MAQGQILFIWHALFYLSNERVEEIVSILRVQHGAPSSPSRYYCCGRTISSATTPFPMFRLHMFNESDKADAFERIFLG